PHSLDADTHTFSFDDAMVAYFAARILGLAMMTPMFKKWGEPKSLTSIPVLGTDEFLRIWRIRSFNLRRWDPGLVADASRALDPDVGRFCKEAGVL
ncbi:MAG: hypothetical protein WCB19_03915, partial [Thermoplasmata archaeon]